MKSSATGHGETGGRGSELDFCVLVHESSGAFPNRLNETSAAS